MKNNLISMILYIVSILMLGVGVFSNNTNFYLEAIYIILSAILIKE